MGVVAKIANAELWTAAAIARDRRIGGWPELAEALSAHLGREIGRRELSETVRKNRGPRSAEERRRACQAVLDTMAWAEAPDAGEAPDLEGQQAEILPPAPAALELAASRFLDPAAGPPAGFAPLVVRPRRQLRRELRELRRLALVAGSAPTRRQWRRATRRQLAAATEAAAGEALRWLAAGHAPADATAHSPDPDRPGE